MNIKEEAFKLADELAFNQGELSMWTRNESCRMIRRLVEELSKATYVIEPKQTKPFPWGDVSNEKLIQEVRDRGYKIRNAEIQTKPLSDEEILEILIDKGICGRLKDGSLCYWQEDADLHDFARAIEERHGIK